MNIKSIGLITLFLIPILVFGQFKSPKDIEKLYWTSEVFSMPDYPEKWQTESAIILNQNESLKYDRFRSDKNVITALRTQILLNDKAAVNEYTIFNIDDKWFDKEKKLFGGGRQFFFMGIRVIKPNGDINYIDVQKKIQETKEADKIAIPNLEPGDVIDYYIHFIRPFILSFEVFPIKEKVLASQYPILEYKFNLQLEEHFYLNYKSFNGAPELEEVSTEDKYNRAYELKASHIEKLEELPLSYPKLELPYYKIQVFFSGSYSGVKKKPYFMSSESKNIKTKVTPDDITRVVNIMQKKGAETMSMEVSRVKDYQDRHPSENKVDHINQAYYYFRYKFSSQGIEWYNYRINDVLKDVKYEYPYSSYPTGNGRTLFTGFISYLESEDVDFELLVKSNVTEESINDLLFVENLNLSVRVNINNEQIIYSFPELLFEFDSFYDENNSYVYLIKERFEERQSIGLKNTNGFVLKKEGMSSRLYNPYVDIQPIEFTRSSQTDHIEIHKTQLLIDLNELNVQVLDTVTSTGQFKVNNQNTYLSYFDYLNDLNKKYMVKSFSDRIKISNKNKIRANERIGAFKESIVNFHHKRIEENFKTRINFIPENYKFNLLESATVHTYRPMEYYQGYQAGNKALKMAGNNLILDINQVLECPFVFNEEDVRVVNFDHLSTQKNIINIPIPNGYGVDYESLIKTIDNNLGKFTVDVTRNNNVLSITTVFTIKQITVNKEDWNQFNELTNGVQEFFDHKLFFYKK